ncbi:hypothetical protein J1N35_030178, partial [Gossypium stocksii]
MGFRCMFKALALFAVTLTVTATSVAGHAKPGCQSKCGNLSIPYPFGTGNGCNISSNFFITCNTNFNPPKAFLTTGDLVVLYISLDGYLRIQTAAGYDCYNSSGRSSYHIRGIRLVKFPLSHTKNNFIAIGCDTYAYVQGSLGHTYSTGCLTFCYNTTDGINGSCSGICCWQTVIPKGVRGYSVRLSSSYNLSYLLDFNPCSYGFVVEDGAYSFSVSHLADNSFSNKTFPIILDWTIGNQTCKEAKMHPLNYACKENSACIDAENGPGYLCKCVDGFQGNPYLLYGCQENNHMILMFLITQLIIICKCIVSLITGIGVSLLSSLLFSSWVYLGLKQRKLTKLKQQNFQQNGGILLREQLSKREECGETTKIFTAEELKNATNNYHDSRIVGRGGQGTVYKGILSDGRSVAIKKSIIGDQSQVQQFINEVIVLSQINHRNVVKFLGC